MSSLCKRYNLSEFIQKFRPAVENTAAQKFRSNEDFEMPMGYFNYLMEEETNPVRLFPSILDKNEDRIFQFSETLLDTLVQ